MNIFQYIEEHYRDGSLTWLAAQLNCEFTWLSKTIKKLTGSTYTELLQKKRLNQACFPLVQPLYLCWISVWQWDITISAISTAFSDRRQG